jgi:ABC-type sugar transport system ATPase subunit
MHLTLDSIGKKVGRQTWLYPMSLQPCSGAVTVLLGATQAGKTSLMRIMAGLDAPTEGNVLVNGQSVLGVPVRQRNVSMVYQQVDALAKKSISRCSWIVIRQNSQGDGRCVRPWHVPRKKPANEKPKGETIAYDMLLNAWKNGKVR